jgi:predicted acyltransferase
MKPERLASLDAFRGLTVAGMILVNNAGDWGHVYGQLEHAAWHGCTATDLIFPFFLFIVGVSTSFSLSTRGPDPALAPILRRAAILFALGLLLNAFPFTLERPVRVMGVLQRISLCYLATALLVARTSVRAQAFVGAGLLVGTWAIMLLPGFDLEKGTDVGAWVDRLLLAGRLHQARPDYALFDPEGLFTTLPAIATTLVGAFAGRWLGASRTSPHERASGLFFAGLVVAVAGLIASSVLPINKSLWTPSYVLFTGGLACQALAACYWLVDLQGVRRWAGPFLAFGRNPIVGFWASHALARLLVFGLVWEQTNAKQWLYEHLFARGASTRLTSLAFAATYVLVWWAIMAVMDRRKIYIKV